jgi:hypothetical protein
MRLAGIFWMHSDGPDVLIRVCGWFALEGGGHGKNSVKHDDRVHLMCG